MSALTVVNPQGTCQPMPLLTCIGGVGLSGHRRCRHRQPTAMAASIIRLCTTLSTWLCAAAHHASGRSPGLLLIEKSSKSHRTSHRTAAYTSGTTTARGHARMPLAGHAVPPQIAGIHARDPAPAPLARGCRSRWAVWPENPYDILSLSLDISGFKGPGKHRAFGPRPGSGEPSSGGTIHRSAPPKTPVRFEGVSPRHKANPSLLIRVSGFSVPSKQSTIFLAAQYPMR
jgi:hypothetical protein